jgi:hypothetical protein
MQSDLVQNVKKFNKASIQIKDRELIQAEGTRQLKEIDLKICLRKIFKNN